MTKISTKKSGLRALALGLALAGSFVFSGTARANEDEAPLTIPDTPAAIWQVINTETTEMEKLITAGTLEDLHRRAFAVRDLVAALPGRSTSLSADQLAQIESNGKFVATLAARLDEAGDAGDKAASESNFDKLKTVLASIRTNYPDSSPMKDGSNDQPAGGLPEGTGKINSFDAEKHTINLTHGPVEALKWPGMTMDFSVAKDVDLSGFKAGDSVVFTLKAGDDNQYSVVGLKPAHESHNH